jgi:LysR family transcriptional activator of glutamate synthase operon
MELRHLRYFCAVATHLSFREASRDLLVAQPALSQQVRSLERELGVTLFDRSSRPIGLTDAGAAMLVHARRILADVSLATDEVRRLASPPQATLTVGAMQYLAHLDLPDLVASFQRSRPEIELRVRVGNTLELMTMMKDEEIDVAICHLDEHGLESGFAAHALRTERLVLITAMNNPVGEPETVQIKSLEHTPFVMFRAGASIRSAVEDAAAREGFVPRVVMESADLATGLELVARGLGVAVVPRSFALHEADRVRHAELGPVPLSRTVALVWPGGTPMAQPLSHFIDHATRSMQWDHAQVGSPA